MSEIFQRLAALLPERHAPGKQSFATDIKALRDWIAHLPLANPTATARLLLTGLKEMNQLRLDPAQRLEALELLRPAIDQIVVLFNKQFIGDGFPPSAQKELLSVMVHEFQQALAVGYIATVCDTCGAAGTIPFMRAKPIALAATRATQHLGARLQQAYLAYRTPPPGVWQGLHDVFRFALAMRMDDKSIDDASLSGAPVSVRSAYTHSLLLALCNPYRFTQRENIEIFALTRVWEPFCEIRQGRAPVGAIAIRVDSDQGPGYLPEEREVPTGDLWAFETAALERMLEGQFAMLPPDVRLMSFRSKGSPVVHADPILVDRLTQAWTGSAERGHARLPAGHPLDAVVGLHGVHYVLAGNQEFDQFVQQLRGATISLSEGDRVGPWANNNGDTRVSKQRARVLDQSLGGYRLIWDKGDVVRAKVGELVALAPPADDDEAQDWMVGVIRWIRLDPNGSLDAGVELLARRAHAVGLRSIDANSGEAGAALRGILLEPLRSNAAAADTQPVTILASLLLDRASSDIELTQAADAYAWKPEARIEMLHHVIVSDGSGAYVRVSVTAAVNEDTTALPAANSDGLNSPINSVYARG